MARDVEQRKSGGLRVRDGAVLVVVGVVGVLVAFWALSAVAGFVWGLVKVVAVLAVLGAILWALVGRRR
ncbi:MAG: hypothetical protein ACYCU7_01675 [Acidimicrobiales bacterium]